MRPVLRGWGWWWEQPRFQALDQLLYDVPPKNQFLKPLDKFESTVFNVQPSFMHRYRWLIENSSLGFLLKF